MQHSLPPIEDFLAATIRLVDSKEEELEVYEIKIMKIRVAIRDLT